MNGTVFAAEVTEWKFFLHYSRVSVPGNEVQQMPHPWGGNVTQLTWKANKSNTHTHTQYNVIYTFLRYFCTFNTPKFLQGLYMIRFHSFYPWHSNGDYMHLCNEKDLQMLPWVKEFKYVISFSIRVSHLWFHFISCVIHISKIWPHAASFYR